MPKRGKKHLESIKNADRQKRHDFGEAVQKAIDLSFAKFDETVDVAVRLGVDPRHAGSDPAWAGCQQLLVV